MDINPLFKLFQQYAEKVKRHEPNSKVFLNITPQGWGHISIVTNGEQIFPFFWADYREGLHRLRINIAEIEK